MLLGIQPTATMISWQIAAAWNRRYTEVPIKYCAIRMCKFTHRLFVFALLLLLQLQWIATAAIVAHKPDGRLLAEFFDQDYDYDLHYDQRQKGNENLRLKMDGFLIGLPAQEPGGLLLLTDDLLENMGEELLLGFGKSRSSSTRAPDHTAALSYNKMEQDLPKLKPVSAAEAIIVELPTLKKDAEARGVELSENDAQQRSRTKFHIFQLLNFLRGNKRA